jgi:hypothetical protein
MPAKNSVNVRVRPNILPNDGVSGVFRDHLHGAVRQSSERSIRSAPESEWLTRRQLLEWQLTLACSRCGSSSYYCGCEEKPVQANS